MAGCETGDRPMTGLRMLSALAGRALDVVLPPLCLGCNGVVSAHRTLCPRCWGAIRFIDPPLCDWCGVPHDVDAGPDVICAACAATKPVFSRARSVFVYTERSRGLVLKFKYADRTDAVPAFSAWMARAGAALLAEADVVAPVPLHWTRLLARKYNQAALLAQAVAARGDRRYVPDLLKRTRRTPYLGPSGRTQRRRIVRGAFAVESGRRAAVEGRRVVLVDDVLTSGATVSACARTLLRAGAAAVDVLTLARVAREAG